ncbi:MAG TPA: AI-2E family transporter [Chthoniobacterales bacterium]
MGKPVLIQPSDGVSFPPFHTDPRTRLTRAVQGLFLLGVFYTLKFAAGIFLPIILAAFLSLLLFPIVRGLREKGLSNTWATSITMVGFLVLLAGLATGIALSTARFSLDSANYLQHLQERLGPFVAKLHQGAPAMEQFDAWINPSNVERVRLAGPGLGAFLLGAAPGFIGSLILVLVLVLFLLLFGENSFRKFVDLLPHTAHQQNAVEMAAEVRRTASRYFTSVTLVNAGVGASVWLSSEFLGLPRAFLWGVAAFLLHYIPFIGATAGILAMSLDSLVHYDSLWPALLPPLAYLFAAMVEGNLATPLILGRWLILNPLAILLAFLLCAYFWGVLGMLLAVPILATFKIFCDRVDDLKPLGQLLGTQ